MAKATLNQLLTFPCPHCQDIRRVSVGGDAATVILPRICPMKPACETEVLRAYYLTMGDAKC